MDPTLRHMHIEIRTCPLHERPSSGACPQQPAREAKWPCSLMAPQQRSTSGRWTCTPWPLVAAPPSPPWWSQPAPPPPSSSGPVHGHPTSVRLPAKSEIITVPWPWPWPITSEPLRPSISLRAFLLCTWQVPTGVLLWPPSKLWFH